MMNKFQINLSNDLFNEIDFSLIYDMTKQNE